MFGMASGQAIAHEGESVAARRESCCSAYHQAVELIGKRWTGAILFVLMEGPLRFSEVKVLVPESELEAARDAIEAMTEPDDLTEDA